MIDWVSAVLHFKHTKFIHGGGVQFIDEDGSVSVPMSKFKMITGSYDSRCKIQTDTKGELGNAIYVSASPKFIQGHNLFGTDDPRLLVAAIAQKALAALGIEVDEFHLEKWKQGRGVKFTKIDATYMLDVSDEVNAASFIEAVAGSSNMKYRGRGENRNGTIYFGKHSRRWALKLYRKFVEVNSKKKDHALPSDIPMREALVEYARGTVRAELTLLSMELKRLNLSNGLHWSHNTAQKVWEDAMKKLDISPNVTLNDYQAERLPRRLRGTYAQWKDGTDVFNMMSRPTYYKHRKELLALGIDISSRPSTQRERVVPVIRYINAVPKTVPIWALNTPLLLAA